MGTVTVRARGNGAFSGGFYNRRTEVFSEFASKPKSIVMPQWTVRLPEELAEQVRKAAEERGFSSPRAFIREALRKELQAHGGPAEELEKRLVASLDRLSGEVRRIGTAQQAQFALTDALAKVFLVCVPEPPRDAVEHARSRAMLRYDKFIKSVATSMTGGSRAALSELVSHGE
jgi:Arc/MetJ-type ribon-helix-helix transcriptional regulator